MSIESSDFPMSTELLDCHLELLLLRKEADLVIAFTSEHPGTGQRRYAECIKIFQQKHDKEMAGFSELCSLEQYSIEKGYTRAYNEMKRRSTKEVLLVIDRMLGIMKTWSEVVAGGDTDGVVDLYVTLMKFYYSKIDLLREAEQEGERVATAQEALACMKKAKVRIRLIIIDLCFYQCFLKFEFLQASLSRYGPYHPNHLKVLSVSSFLAEKCQDNGEAKQPVDCTMAVSKIEDVEC